MRINPGLSLIKLSATTAQIGSGVTSLHLTGCTPNIWAMLTALRAGIPDGTEETVANTHGISNTEFQRLANYLAPALLSHEPSPQNQGDESQVTDLASVRRARKLNSADYRSAVGGMHALDAQVGDGVLSHVRAISAEDFRTQRESTTVQIIGLSRLGAMLSQLLFDSGITRQWLVDNETVTDEDVRHGYRPGDIGRLRSAASASRLDSRTVFALTAPGPTQLKGDLSVVVSHGLPEEQLLHHALQSHHPVLPVSIFDDATLIGPWAHPGLHCCANCLVAMARAEDPLHFRTRQAVHAPEQELHSLAMATTLSGILGLQVLNWIDASQLRETVPKTFEGSIPGMHVGTVVELRSDTGLAFTHQLERHPDCPFHHEFGVADEDCAVSEISIMSRSA